LIRYPVTTELNDVVPFDISCSVADGLIHEGIEVGKQNSFAVFVQGQAIRDLIKMLNF
jgi:hypothetical protein